MSGMLGSLDIEENGSPLSMQGVSEGGVPPAISDTAESAVRKKEKPLGLATERSLIILQMAGSPLHLHLWGEGQIVEGQVVSESQAPVAHTCNPSYSGGRDQ
jgi:hypothetical protein